jgi:MoxR-like ATPase
VIKNHQLPLVSSVIHGLALMLKNKEPSHTQLIATKLAESVRKVIIGGDQAIELATIGLLCQGHLLIEDVPGVGKTMLARSLAFALGCSFSRIQFTPDILPADITGAHVFDPATGLFEFQPGPIMAQIVLIDEINRAAPKAQAALLEAMEEKQITVDRAKYSLPDPFIVLATVNRVESHSTFPLPKSQLDRFFLRIQLGYLSPEDEILVMKRQKTRHPIEDLSQSLSIDDLTKARKETRQIYVSPILERYIVALVEETRRHADVHLGGSPRSSLVLYHGSQARAAIHGRGYVLPDDIKSLVVPALGHRLLLSPRAHIHKQNVEDILEEILDRTPIPERVDGQNRPIDRMKLSHEI